MSPSVPKLYGIGRNIPQAQETQCFSENIYIYICEYITVTIVNIFHVK